MHNVDAAGLGIGDDHPPRIMGVLNVSRESPYDPSVFADPDNIVGERKEPSPELEELIGGRFIQHPEPEVFDVRVLARMDHPDLGDMPVAWVKPYGDGRSFYTALGHFRSAFEGEARALLGAGVRWAGGRA